VYKTIATIFFMPIN